MNIEQVLLDESRILLVHLFRIGIILQLSLSETDVILPDLLLPFCIVLHFFQSSGHILRFPRRTWPILFVLNDGGNRPKNLNITLSR